MLRHLQRLQLLSLLHASKVGWLDSLASRGPVARGCHYFGNFIIALTTGESWKDRGSGATGVRIDSAQVVKGISRASDFVPAYSSSGSGTACSRPRNWRCCPTGRPASAPTGPTGTEWAATSAESANCWRVRRRESACKKIGGGRFERAGFRWSKTGGNALLAIRCCLEDMRRPVADLRQGRRRERNIMVEIQKNHEMHPTAKSTGHSVPPPRKRGAVARTRWHRSRVG